MFEHRVFRLHELEFRMINRKEFVIHARQKKGRNFLSFFFLQNHVQVPKKEWRVEKKSVTL